MRLVATPARGFRVHIPFPAEGEGFQAGRADARFVSALSGEHAGRDRAREEQRRRSGYPSSDEAEVAAGPLSSSSFGSRAVIKIVIGRGERAGSSSGASSATLTDREQ